MLEWIVFFWMLLIAMHNQHPTPEIPREPVVIDDHKEAAKPQEAPQSIVPKDLADLLLFYQPKLSRDEADRYASSIYSAASDYNIDPLWIVAMMWQESRFINNSRSKAGAVGLMQILPNTARSKGINPENLTVPEINIQTGASYLADMIELFGSLKKGTIAYNQGPSKVKKGSYRTGYYSNVSKHYADIQENYKERAARLHR
ncbi:lytic transglycosylase domain-containing protein [Paenibacillus sp. NPDC058071]|uniref:lytic transglycosylase domain-containing protein n=1 Tax=Paenibacillus sp. NPDC058071 TaxID=3346326 RepID=UPI0036DC5FB4